MKIKTVFPFDNTIVYIQTDDNKVYSLNFDTVEICQSGKKRIVKRDYSYNHDLLLLLKCKISFGIDEIKQLMQPVSLEDALSYKINFGNCAVKRENNYVNVELGFYPFRNHLNIGVCESYGNGSSECGGCLYYSVLDLISNNELRQIVKNANANWILDIVDSTHDLKLISRRIMDSFLTRSGCRNRT